MPEGNPQAYARPATQPQQGMKQPGQMPADRNRQQQGQAPNGPNPNGVIANGLARLTEEEMIALDGFLESNPELTGLIVKAFPREAAAIQHFLKSVTSGMEQPANGAGAQPGAQQPMQRPGPGGMDNLASIGMR